MGNKKEKQSNKEKTCNYTIEDLINKFNGPKNKHKKVKNEKRLGSRIR